jgi:hypothetical protein
MRLRVTGLGVVVVALAAIGCSDRIQPIPGGPRMQAAAPPSGPLTCDFKALSQLATRYFSGPEAKAVRDLISQMQTAGAFSLTAKSLGFDAMAHIAANVKAGNTDVADASSLTNGLLVCMFSSTADLPTTFPEDFTIATNPADSGGYEVRGGTADLTGPVLSRPLTAPFSGVGPSGSNTWPGILSGNPAPARVLVYGEPGPLPLTYEWRVVPRSTEFSPPAIVGVCLDANSNATSLMTESSVLLPFADAAFLPPCSGIAMQSWSSQFASRMARWGIGLFGPRALSATTYLNPGGLAGSTGGIHSLFGPQVVQTVTLTFTVQPTDVTVTQPITPPVVVSATAVGTTTPVPNVTITLVAVNNNGTPALLSGTLTKTTDASGTVTFDDLSESKTGAYTLVASGAVNGRPAIGVPQVTSNRFNVRP